jgi:hypothetical protein
VNYPDGTKKDIIGPFETLLASEIVKQNLISKDSACNQLEIKVNDNGTEKSFKQFYVKEFKKTDFTDENIHDKLTGVDSTQITDNDRDSVINLDGTKDIDLTGENLTDAAGKTIVGLTFKVEIGAVKDTSNFKLAHLEKYGKIISKVYPDGMTRYTFGPFETLKEAEDFKQMLTEKEAASKDAFVTVFVFGQNKKVDDIKDEQRKELGIPIKEFDPVVVDPVITEPLVVDAGPVPCVSEVKDFAWFIGKDLNDKSVYDKLITLGGNSCAEGLEFKVQIAAYRFPKNYKWNHLKQYGDPLVLDYPDGVTRFTQGSFNTLKVAEDLRQKIIKSGQKDAWITPFYNGKRMLLEELFIVNFYGKSIN